jgi:hypothetical protein
VLIDKEVCEREREYVKMRLTGLTKSEGERKGRKLDRQSGIDASPVVWARGGDASVIPPFVVATSRKTK